MNPELIIGNNIKLLREMQGMKIQTLASAINIGKSRMSQIENGDCKELTLNRIGKIAETLQVNFFQIVTAHASYLNVDTESNSDFHDKSFSLPPQAVKAIVDQVVERMRQQQ